MSAATKTPLWEARSTALSIHYNLSISYGTAYGNGDGDYGYLVHCTEHDDVVVDEGDGLSLSDIADLPVYVAKEAGIDLDKLDEHARRYR